MNKKKCVYKANRKREWYRSERARLREALPA